MRLSLFHSKIACGSHCIVHMSDGQDNLASGPALSEQGGVARLVVLYLLWAQHVTDTFQTHAACQC